jgi:hypothetical protein
MAVAVRETGRFMVELEFGGLLTVVELERGRDGGWVPCLATEDGRPVYRVSDGVYQIEETGEVAYRIEL